MEGKSPKPKIEVQQIIKTYKDAKGQENQVLQEVDLKVYEKEFFCLLGVSGCGKSTLLRLMAGFDSPTAGNILVDGKTMEAPRSDCIMIFQDYGLFPWRNVLGNVEYGLEVLNVPTVERRGKALELIELVGLQDFVRAFPRELSGGMKQRVALARALAVEPEIIFMDEPLGALDAITRLKMQDEIIRIWEEKNTTVVMVTHDINEAVYLGDRIAIMSGSKGNINKLLDIPLERPRNRASHNFMKMQDHILSEFEISVAEDVEFCI